MKNRLEYTIAYSQVSFFIENLPKQYIEKLPNNLIDFIKSQSSDEYKFNIDSDKSLFMQDYSDKAKALIAVLKYNYWSNDEQKRKLNIILENNEHNYVMEHGLSSTSTLYKSLDIDDDGQLALTVPYSNSFLIKIKKILLKILNFFK